MRKFLSLLFLFACLVAHPAWAALAIDGTGGTNGSCSSGAGQTCAAAITTSSTNDILIAIYKNDFDGPAQVTSVSDTAGLTWTSRKVLTWASGNADGETWYAVAPSTLTSDTVTVHYSSSTHAPRVVVFAVSGANTVTPFDANASLPDGTAQNATTTSVANTISTSNANDLIFNVFGADTPGAITRPSGFSQATASGSITDVSYKVVSATQSSLGITYTYATAAPSYLITDAIKQATVANSSSIIIQGLF